MMDDPFPFQDGRAHDQATFRQAGGWVFIFRLAPVRMAWLIIAGVQPEQKTLDIRRVAKSVLAGLLVMSLLFVAVLSASPALHHHFHHDAANHNHSCAAALLQHGQMMVVDAPQLLEVFALLLLFCLPLAQPARFSSPDLRLGFGRAPPRFPGFH